MHESHTVHVFIMSSNTRAAKIHGRVKIREGPIIMCKHCRLACVCPTINLPSIRLKRQNAHSLKETPLKSVVNRKHPTASKLKYTHFSSFFIPAKVYRECKQPVCKTIKNIYRVLLVEIIIWMRYHYVNYLARRYV